jgi:PEGA domain
MRLGVVAIPLFAAICLASPAIADGDQAQRGRGYRPHDGGGGQTAERSGGDNRGGGERNRTAGTNDNRAEERRAANRSGDRTADNGGDGGADNQRYARPRDNGTVVVTRNRPVVVTRNRPVNVNVVSGYRGPRYYAPVHYDRWARHYYRWSPIGYAPWSLIYGSIGFSNYGFYGGFAPSTYYYGYNGYYGPGPYYSPWQAGGYDIGGVRLKIRPRDAQVFVDGHYAGLVDDFDGTFQSLRLESGGHKIEIHMPGFEDLELDVHVQPGRTITLEEQLRPRP